MRPPSGLRPTKNLCASARPLSLTLVPPPWKNDMSPARLLMQWLWSTGIGPWFNTCGQHHNNSRNNIIARVDDRGYNRFSNNTLSKAYTLNTYTHNTPAG